MTFWETQRVATVCFILHFAEAFRKCCWGPLKGFISLYFVIGVIIHNNVKFQGAQKFKSVLSFECRQIIVLIKTKSRVSFDASFVLINGSKLQSAFGPPRSQLLALLSLLSLPCSSRFQIWISGSQRLQCPLPPRLSRTPLVSPPGPPSSLSCTHPPFS